jgi:hypothetical protein
MVQAGLVPAVDSSIKSVVHLRKYMSASACLFPKGEEMFMLL